MTMLVPVCVRFFQDVSGEGAAGPGLGKERRGAGIHGGDMRAAPLTLMLPRSADRWRWRRREARPRADKVCVHQTRTRQDLS